ncbi:hypothetical protein AVEN_166679-1 [Araneus ventricosus]|uniref:Uncharacterized protein n=1 Tax=Araneus ventricosus TaxID=182803 RepID=A0A4Y2HHG9_ARAVE|nr:hypothetical protein AVEN_166679-1 [Araneus ventricosus]
MFNEAVRCRRPGTAVWSGVGLKGQVGCGGILDEATCCSNSSQSTFSVLQKRARRQAGISTPCSVDEWEEVPTDRKKRYVL